MVLWSALIFQRVYGDGECGKTPIRTVAVSLSPCIGAANDVQASVPAICCIQVKKLLSFPTCSCAVYNYSPTEKRDDGANRDEIVQSLGINITTAITIPMRCNLTNLFASQKCANYTIP